MDFTRAYKFRLYPDSKRQSEIDLQLTLSKNFYNKLLEMAKAAYESDKTFGIRRSTLNRIKRDIIAENRDFLEIYSQTRCEIEDRVIKAYQNFFRRCKERKSGKKAKAGFPRFKSRDKYYSIVYPQENGSFSIEKDRLRVSRIGRMKIKIDRGIEGKIKTLTIKREAGKYYAIFTAIKEVEVAKVADIKPVGIDLGLNSFIATSDGGTVEKPKFMPVRRKRIARWQRIVARRKIGSRRMQRAKARLQEEYAHVANQSNDYLHKLSGKLVNSGYTSFAVEKLDIGNMMKNHCLAGSIQNASWGRFVRLLSYKAESAGLRVVGVDANGTSKQCSNCGGMLEMPLSVRIYDCDRCGLRLDRDVNASINILKRATAGLAGSHARGDGARPQNEAAVAEPRTIRLEIEAGNPRL